MDLQMDLQIDNILKQNEEFLTDNIDIVSLLQLTFMDDLLYYDDKGIITLFGLNEILEITRSMVDVLKK